MFTILSINSFIFVSDYFIIITSFLSIIVIHNMKTVTAKEIKSFFQQRE